MMRCINCEHGEMSIEANERPTGALFRKCNLCHMEKNTEPDYENELTKGLRSFQTLIDSQFVFANTGEIEEFARDHLNMVGRDAVAEIAAQELHMTPPREENP